MKRPQRWDQPFDPNMTQATVAWLLSEPNVWRILQTDGQINPISVENILLNDCKLQHYQRGDIIVRRGDYGGSAFLVISGLVKVIAAKNLPDSLLGRQTPHPPKTFWQALSQSWKNATLPEVRRFPKTVKVNDTLITRQNRVNDLRVVIPDIDAVFEQYQTDNIKPTELFGEIATLERTPRSATALADQETVCLEIRWQGLRDLRRYNEHFRAYIDQVYRERSLARHLKETPLFQHVSQAQLDVIISKTLFEAYGEFDWHTSFSRMLADNENQSIDLEPIIAEQGHYVDGLIMISSGFARVSTKFNHGYRTLDCLKQKDLFGYSEIAHNWITGEHVPWQNQLQAMGYVNILRIPTHVIEELVLPNCDLEDFPALIRPPANYDEWRQQYKTQIDPEIFEFLIETRFINGSATMVIDLDRCVGCDDCVRACAATHNNNPRFIRHGEHIGKHMVTHACMHCYDATCLIGCPTGAIYRDEATGKVVINDMTCIGCATCANSCSYGNIQMVEIRDTKGQLILDEESNASILKASKCDLCIDQRVAPACEKACPHDALIRLDMADKKMLSEWFTK